jgi:phosphoribosyl 1,2-cyclic phosphodiesterase
LGSALAPCLRAPRYHSASGVFAIVRVCVLATSSSGNCTYIGGEHTRILIDAGLSKRETFARLQAIGVAPESLSAIIVTHEHSDHVAGLPVLARALKIPVYLSKLTAPTIDWGDWKEGTSPTVKEFQAGAIFYVGDMRIQSFTIPHDAIDPVGFMVETEGIRVSLAMDLGYIPENVRHHIRGSQLTVLESNHDLDMLKVGPYPWSLKQRVMSRKGHLSNDATADYILEDMALDAHTLVLGHLSEQNNHPEIVRLVANQALQRRGVNTRLIVTEPRKQGELFEY